MRDTKGSGHWVGVAAGVSLAALAKGGSSKVVVWISATGFAIAASLALVLYLHARMQPPCWQLERKSGREFYRRQTHTLLGLSSIYWAPPLAAASVFLVWLAVRD